MYTIRPVLCRVVLIAKGIRMGTRMTSQRVTFAPVASSQGIRIAALLRWPIADGWETEPVTARGAASAFAGPIAARADYPSSASPTTSKPSASSSARADDRKPGWSSTITTVGLTSRSSHAAGPLASGPPLTLQRPGPLPPKSSLGGQPPDAEPDNLRALMAMIDTSAQRAESAFGLSL